MLPMYVTFEVSKLERSSEEREEQAQNIQDMLVTFEVSKLETSSEVREEHS